MRVQITVAAPWQPILKELFRRLAVKGIVPRGTFDLQFARQSLRSSEVVACPHHESELCSCQYLVLHVGCFGKNAAAIVLHGYHRTTKIVLISAAGERVDESLAAGVFEAVGLANWHTYSVGTDGGRGVGGRAVGMTRSSSRRGGG